MYNKVLSFILSMAMLVSLLCISPLSSLATGDIVKIYVDSTSGDDGNTGFTDASPVKTLSKAFSLVALPGTFYEIILADGNYASPGAVNIPNNAAVEVTATGEANTVTIYKNPETPAQTRLFEFNSKAFSSITFTYIKFTGDDPATTETIETAGEGIYLYDCDRTGNTIEFQNCVFENLETGINAEYSDYIGVHVLNSSITANRPIRMDYGNHLVVDNSTLKMSAGEYWNSVVNLNGSTLNVEVTNSTLIGNNGVGRGIYEDLYYGLIRGNTFKDLNIAIECNDIYTATISDNIIETSNKGLDLETYFSTGNISITNNTILNKGLKTNGAVGIELDSNYNTKTGSFIVQDNKILNFYTGLDYSDDYTSTITFTFGGAGHGNTFWGNVLNVDWNSYISTVVDATGNDWGTTSLDECHNRIYADGEDPALVFQFDDTITTSALPIVYVDDNYSKQNAGEHTYGVDAFSSILDALPFVMSGGQILVESGSYIAPPWIDRPVHIKGAGQDTILTKHPALTASDSTMTTITAPNVTVENLRFTGGNYGLRFDSFTLRNFSSYPDAYKVLGCSFIDFDHIALYDGSYYDRTSTENCEIRNNTINRNLEYNNGCAVYLECKAENLYFTGNTINGNYTYGASLNGQNIYANENSITVQPSYEYSALSINSRKNLQCFDNTMVAGDYSPGYNNTGITLYFDGAESSVKEVYRNTIHGFNTGLYISGTESSDLFDITIGGSVENANDFSGNQIGLTSTLFNYDSEPTNASYNIWGMPDDQLPAYINDSADQTYYGPVTYLPTVPSGSDVATLSELSASGVTLTPAFSADAISYSANVSYSKTSTTITALPTDSNATVTINGTAGTTKELSLSVGKNTITVVVTAENTQATKTYTITINRSGSSGGGGSSVEIYYTIQAIAGEGGKISPESAKVSKNSNAEFKIIPNPGNRVKDVLVNGKSVGAVTSYTFKNVTANATISVTFEPTTLESDVVASPFDDVSTDDWFYNSVLFVYDKNLMSGTGQNLFSPYQPLSRGMLVTILYRMEKEPNVTTVNFSDVSAGDYYANAIGWAKENKLVEGINAVRFNPKGAITREQLVTILYRYAKFKGYDTSKTGDFGSFNDKASISDYAKDGLSWGIGAGLIKGKTPHTLAPRATATRAEFASILQRFMQTIGS